jgi:urease accessory protein
MTGLAVADRAHQLDLVFGRTGGAGPTRLVSRRVAYPFSVADVFRLDRTSRDPASRDRATVILQSASGGLFEDEDLSLSIAAQQGSQARFTTPSAAVVHGMPGGGMACQDVTLKADEDARLEYLPKPLILFPGSRLRQRIVIEASEDATVLACDGFLMHTPRGAEGSFDWLDTSTEIRRPGGLVVACERMRVTGAAIAQGSAGLSGSFRAFGWIALIGGTYEAEAEAAVLDAIAGCGEAVYAGASRLPGDCGVMVRIAARDGGALLPALEAGVLAVQGVLKLSRPMALRAD